jgi:hypothetical protein
VNTIAISCNSVQGSSQGGRRLTPRSAGPLAASSRSGKRPVCNMAPVKAQVSWKWSRSALRLASGASPLRELATARSKRHVHATYMWRREGDGTKQKLRAWTDAVRSVRCRIVKIFGTWKRSYGLRCMRWVGFAKAMADLRGQAPLTRFGSRAADGSPRTRASRPTHENSSPVQSPKPHTGHLRPNPQGTWPSSISEPLFEQPVRLEHALRFRRHRPILTATSQSLIETRVEGKRRRGQGLALVFA